jgi:hypothetical protein
MDDPKTVQFELEQLRRLIGRGVVYRGVPCCVIDVLEDGPSLVLRDREGWARQTNQFGEPRREVPETYTVPVHGEAGDLNSEFMNMQVTGDC